MTSPRLQSSIKRKKTLQESKSKEEENEAKTLQEMAQVVFSEVKSDKEVFKGIASTVDKIIKNIVDSPEEEKFRVLRYKNKLVQSKLCVSASVPELLKMLGFSTITNDEGEKCFSCGKEISPSYLKSKRLEFAAIAAQLCG